jgi:hypothetical protein
MAFIGKEPQTGAYSMLDNLTASATASYSLTLDSVAFLPESANHLIVSLNGVIQKAGSSYNVSGSTLTFSSTLASSDSIDFVLALGNVLDIGTPSDSTVTNAKTNFVSTSSAAGLQIKGDGTTDGTLQLNCSQNSHGIKLKSPAHSTSSSYTLTFPGTDPSADKFLKTDGSGNLSFADAGESNTPSFYAYGTGGTNVSTATLTRIGVRGEIVDNGGCYNNTSSSTTLNGITAPADAFTPNVAGLYYFTGAVRLNTDDYNVGLVNNLGGVGGSESYSALIYRISDDLNHVVMVSGFANMNGSGNNMSLTAYQETGGTLTTHDSIYTTYFGGFLVKAT